MKSCGSAELMFQLHRNHAFHKSERLSRLSAECHRCSGVSREFVHVVQIIKMHIL